MAIWQEPTWLQNYIAEQKANAGTFGERYLKPFEQAAIAGISAYKSGEKSDKIKSIIDAETNAAQSEGRELDYRKLEKLLLPYDQELSMKYGALADKAEAKAEEIAVKREAITAKAELEKQKALAKQQELTNKFDLTTEEGKLAWKNQFNKLQTATWQPGFATADEETVKKPVLNQMESLIEQAQGYPELLASVGLKAKVKPTVTPTAEQEVTYQFKTVFDPTTGETINVPITSAVSEAKPTEVQPQEKVNHLDAIISLINAKAKPNNLGVLNSADLISIVNKYSQDNLQGLDKKIRDEIVASAKEVINAKAEEAKAIHSEKVAATQRAKEDKKYQASMTQDAYKALQTSPEYVSYKATNDAIAGYNASNKDAVAKRKLVYDYIKSYNTGTVLDSELNSTIGGISGGAGLLTAIKNKAGLEALNTITDEQINSIVSNMQKSLATQKSNVDRKAKELEKVYGAKITEQKPETKPSGSNYKLKKMLGSWFESFDGGKTWAPKK